MNAFLDTLPLWVALVPLGLYLVALGMLHLRRRPLVMSGGWDAALLTAALAGLALVGPLALIRPAVGSSLWGWLVVLMLAALLAAVCMLVMRPRLVIYNITGEQLRPLVAEVVSVLDPATRWAGETAALPTRGLQLQIEANGAMRTASVIAVGERAGSEDWNEFCRRLRRSARRLRVRPSPWGPPFAAAGALVIAAAAWLGCRPLPDAAARAAGERVPAGDILTVPTSRL